jgi:hypothetical protein
VHAGRLILPNAYMLYIHACNRVRRAVGEGRSGEKIESPPGSAAIKRYRPDRFDIRQFARLRKIAPGDAARGA